MNIKKLVLTNDKREPEAPSEVELEGDILEAYVKRLGGHEEVEYEVGEPHQ